MTTFNRITAVIAAVAVVVVLVMFQINRRGAAALESARTHTTTAITLSKEAEGRAAQALIVASEYKLVATKALDRAAKAAADSSYKPAYLDAKLAADTLLAAVDTLVPALKSTLAANARLRAAAGHLVDVSKPSFWSHLVPKVGFGGAVGIDPVTMQPSKTVGLTLSWAI